MILAGLTLGRRHRHPVWSENQPKGTSVPDFRREEDSLQFRPHAKLLGQTGMGRPKTTVRYAARIKRGGSDPNL
jgi:hypothetical protein